MTKQEFASRLQNACAAVTAAEQELTEIDSRFGDADHGLTMSKIAKAISAAAGESEGGIQAMLDDAAMAVMVLNGGSAVPYAPSVPRLRFQDDADKIKYVCAFILGRFVPKKNRKNL